MQCSLLIFLEVKSCLARQKLGWRNLITWAIFTIKILPKIKIQCSIQLLSSNKADMFISLSCHEFCLSNDHNIIILKQIYHYKFTIQVQSVFFQALSKCKFTILYFPNSYFFQPKIFLEKKRIEYSGLFLLLLLFISIG